MRIKKEEVKTIQRCSYCKNTTLKKANKEYFYCGECNSILVNLVHPAEDKLRTAQVLPSSQTSSK